MFLYRQSTPVMTPLRNRKTGQQVKAIAKQQVVTLETTDAVLGLVASNDRFFVLTQDTLYMMKI